MAMKSLHKYQLKLLALQSVVDQPIKDLLAHLITSQTFQLSDGDSFETSDKPGEALAEVLTMESANSIKQMHFLTYPETQCVVFEDGNIRPEIKISRLDILAVCDILRYCSLLPAASTESHSLENCLETLTNFRFLLATENNEGFWDCFDKQDGVSLSFSASSYNWEHVWKENKKAFVKILKHLRYLEIMKEKHFVKHIEEIQLFATWSKQEILQNWYQPMLAQYKALGFLHRIEMRPQYKREQQVSIKVTDKESTSSDTNGLMASVFQYLQSFFRAPRDPTTPIQDFGLDGIIAKTLSMKVKNLIDDIFGDRSFIEVNLMEISKGIKMYENDDFDAMVPFALQIKTSSYPAHILRDSESVLSVQIWKDISEEIRKCVEVNMNLEVNCIRTGWYNQSQKIKACLFKTSGSPWTPDECTKLINHLQSWDFPFPLELFANPQVLENLATMVFRMSTTNPQYFELMDRFVKLMNEQLMFTSIHLDRLNVDLDIGKELCLNSSLQFIKAAADDLTNNNKNMNSCSSSSSSSISSKSFVEFNGNDSGFEDRTYSPRNNEPSSQPTSARKAMSLRLTTTPRKNDGKNNNGNRPSFSRESSFISEVKLKSEDNSPRKPSPRNNQQTSPPPPSTPKTNSTAPHDHLSHQDDSVVQQQNGSSLVENGEHYQNEALYQLDSTDGANQFVSKLSEDWMKLHIAKEFLLKPALLDILHLQGHGYPINKAQLYTRIKELRRCNPKAFEIWRKSELNNILLPDTEESDSSLWTIDMIYFVIRTAILVPEPKNGWKDPREEDGGAGFWCWEARQLKNAIEFEQVQIDGGIAEVLDRVKSVLKGLNYNDRGLLRKLQTMKMHELAKLF